MAALGNTPPHVCAVFPTPGLGKRWQAACCWRPHLGGKGTGGLASRVRAGRQASGPRSRSNSVLPATANYTTWPLCDLCWPEPRLPFHLAAP